MKTFRSALEQTAVYAVLLVLLGVMVLFGISTAEKGINSLVGTDDPQALAVSSSAPGQVDLKILGKNVDATDLPWAEQLSRNLDSTGSATGEAVDEASMTVGTWMQAGAQTFLDTLKSWLN